jgi:hypothetical protein
LFTCVILIIACHLIYIVVAFDVTTPLCAPTIQTMICGSSSSWST